MQLLRIYCFVFFSLFLFHVPTKVRNRWKKNNLKFKRKNGTQTNNKMKKIIFSPSYNDDRLSTMAHNKLLWTRIEKQFYICFPIYRKKKCLRNVCIPDRVAALTTLTSVCVLSVCVCMIRLTLMEERKRHAERLENIVYVIR